MTTTQDSAQGQWTLADEQTWIALSDHASAAMKLQVAYRAYVGEAARLLATLERRDNGASLERHVEDAWRTAPPHFRQIIVDAVLNGNAIVDVFGVDD